ncbi:2-dehydropantoate 2-reductase (Ketopantoate reductase) (KPA reductase) (KPR) [Ciborinia camelliae]|nr:2-dehydropantoate 2-reductase (Ketopantoate reductase) (KPA reductase) (KPR) [Ciborinia camelliae]
MALRQNGTFWWPRRKGRLHASLSCVWGSERDPTTSGLSRSYVNIWDGVGASDGPSNNDITDQEGRRAMPDVHANVMDIDSRDELELELPSEEENDTSFVESAYSGRNLEWEADMRLSPGELHDNNNLEEPADAHISGVGREYLLSPGHPDIDMDHADQESPVVPFYEHGQEILQSSRQTDIYDKLQTQESLYREDRSVSRTIHVLGTGPIGQFIAYNLAALDLPPPITLLMHRPLLLQQWRQSAQVLRVFKDGVTREQSGFNVELSASFNIPGPESEFRTTKHIFEYTKEVIENLVITTNGAKTVAALTSIRHRLRSHSTICFVQHGAGVIEDVNTHVFPDLQDRPHYILGNLSHGLFATDHLWTVAHNTQGELKLSIPQPDTDAPTDGLLTKSIDRKLTHSWAPTSRYMLMVLSRSPQLEAIALNYPDFMKFHLEFIAVNSVIGPLSVIFDCSNDQLLYNFEASKTMKSLLKEISGVLISLPELKTVSKISTRFGKRRLESMVLSVLARTGKNVTTMLQNVRSGMKTDIDFYNGYLARRAKELGIPFTANELIIGMVKAKQAMKSREMNSYIPVVDRR